MSYSRTAARSRRRAFGSVDFSNQCLTEEALKGPGPKWCSCYREYGEDAQGERGHRGDMWAPLVGMVVAAIAEWQHANPAAPAGGAPPWGHALEPFDWAGTAVRAWFRPLELTSTQGESLSMSCGDGSSIGNGSMLSLGGRCCMVCLTQHVNTPYRADCVLLNNGCASDGLPSTETHFGGPVLEYFNFARVLRLLAQWPTVQSLPASYAENYRVDPTISTGMKTAYTNLQDLLGRSWPELDRPFNQTAHEIAKVRLLNHKRPVRDVMLAQLGKPPYHWVTWFNHLRFLAQRVPGGDGWHCVWQTPLVTDIDTPFDPLNPFSTGQLPVLYRHAPSTTITAGDWLASLLDMLAPGWQLRSVASTPRPRPSTTASGAAPSAATTAAAATAAAGGIAALVWFLL